MSSGREDSNMGGLLTEISCFISLAQFLSMLAPVQILAPCTNTPHQTVTSERPSDRAQLHFSSNLMSSRALNSSGKLW